MNRATHFLRRCRTWAGRIGVSFLRPVGIVTPSMHATFLEWLLEDLGADHPHIPKVISEIAELKGCRG